MGTAIEQAIANKWTAMIVIALGDQRLRFVERRTRVDGISGKVLAVTLRDLERDGLVTRHAYATVPPRALGKWAEENIEAVLSAREAYKTRS